MRSKKICNFLITSLLMLIINAVLGHSKVDHHSKHTDENHENQDHQEENKHHHHHNWDYTKEGQLNWRESHQECAGEGQSPIRVSTKHAMLVEYPAIEMVGYHNPLPTPVTLTNNGHSVTLNPGTTNDPLPYIFGGPLKGEYELVSLHCHWGRQNNRGSEHIINSIRYAMEMHIIHKSRKYESVVDALKHPDGIAVVAFFFQAGERHNMKLDHLIKELPNVKHSGDKTDLKRSFALSWLKPKDIDTFYTYKGSLTTPPCSEAVTWLLFPSAIHVSFDQMTLFRKLSNGDGALVDNFRFPQPLNSRKIYVRRLKVIQNSTYPHNNNHHHHHN